MSTPKCKAHMGRGRLCGRLKGHKGTHRKVSLNRRERKPSASPDLDTKLIDGFLKLCAAVDKLESNLKLCEAVDKLESKLLADDDDCATQGTLPDAADMFAALSRIVNDETPALHPTAAQPAEVYQHHVARLKDLALQGAQGGNLNELRKAHDEWTRIGALPLGADGPNYNHAAHAVADKLTLFFDYQLDVRDSLSQIFTLKDQDVQDARYEAIKARGEAKLANLKLGAYEAAMDKIAGERCWRCAVCDDLVFSDGEPDEDQAHDTYGGGEKHEPEWQEADNDAGLAERHRYLVSEARGAFKATVVK